MDWSILYPQYFRSNDEQTLETQKCVEFADVGCGYGGLLGNLFLLFFLIFNLIYYKQDLYKCYMEMKKMYT